MGTNVRAQSASGKGYHANDDDLPPELFSSTKPNQLTAARKLIADTAAQMGIFITAEALATFTVIFIAIQHDAERDR